jgi:SAM-dependent methyltransferase
VIWGEDLAAWWIDEVASDPAYTTEVVPLALDLLAAEPGAIYLDLGCGDGHMMRRVIDAGGKVVGCDGSPLLAARAAAEGPVVVGRLPGLPWVRSAAFSGAYAVLVLEHIGDVEELFAAAAAAVRPGGVLVVVINHPAVTSPGSGPFLDPEDGETLWRWGPYLDAGSSSEPAGDGAVIFYHRSMGDLLTAAADAGWSLQRMVEAGLGPERAAADPLLAAQQNIPRLLGVRWGLAARR